MYLRSVELNNFQKHTHLLINFTEGVNVIYGRSDAGKSCIRRAIEWVCQNAKIDGIRKTGTKITSVKVTLDNDVVVERQRSASINRYIIHKDDEDIVFDAIGRSIPQEVKDVLKLEPINIEDEDIYLNSAPQIALPFLFDKSPTFRMKLFNKLTGNDVLDKLFVQFNKNILGISREHKRESERMEGQIITLSETKTKKDHMEDVLKQVTKSMDNLKKLHTTHSKLLELLELVTHNNVTIKETKRNLSLIKIPDLSEIKGLIEEVDRLEALNDVETLAERTQISLEKVRGQITEIKLPTLNLEGLNGKITRLDSLINVKKDLDNTQDQCYTLSNKLEKIKHDLDTKKIALEKLRKSIKICKECGQEIN